MTTAGWLVVALGPMATLAVTVMVALKRPGFSRVDHPWHGGNSSYAISFLAAVIALLGAAHGFAGPPMWTGLGCFFWLMGVSLWRHFQIVRYRRRPPP